MILSDEQLAAVTATESRILVAANPGSGKTAVIVERVKYLLSIGITPNTIFAITYTNSAAQEMAERIGSTDIFVGTLHSLANRILKFNGVDTSHIIEDGCFYKLLEIAKNRKLNLPFVVHLLVDEFQDICDDEYDFIINTLKAENIFLVGDSQQAIYGFKGGNFEHLVFFAKQKTTKVYELTNNYRNSKSIYNFAKKYIYGVSNIYHIQTNLMRSENGMVMIEDYDDKLILAIINTIGEFKDWFILARTNAQVNYILSLLRIHNIPCDTFKKSQKTFAELKSSLQEDTVKVLTIHSAKGLECKYSIITGINTWNDEERRVSYVACTRAKDLLIILNNANKKKGRYTPVPNASKVISSIKKGIPDAHLKQYPCDSRNYDSNGLIPSIEYTIASAIEIATAESYLKHFDEFTDDDVMDFELMGHLPTLDN